VAVGPGVRVGVGVIVEVGLGAKVAVADGRAAVLVTVEEAVGATASGPARVQLASSPTHRIASPTSRLVVILCFALGIDCFQNSWIAAIITNCWRIIESMMQFSLLNAHQARPLFSQLIDIYQAVFSGPPFHESLPDYLNFAGRLSYHARQAGFRCAVAWPEPDAPVVGFAYGYPGHVGSWFYDLVSARLPAAVVQEYLSDYFEFAEMGLLPDWQNQGLGGKLHDSLLSGLSQRTACLCTPQVETRALHLYLKRGWKPLLTNLPLPGTILKYQIMGKKLQS